MIAIQHDATDEDLIRRTLAGQRGAFSALVSRHRAHIAGLALRALGDADDAQDVAQETFLYAYLRLGDLRDPARFGPWLRSVALSLCADHRRRRATRPLPGQPWSAAAPEAADAPPDHAQRLVVRDALRRLPPAQRLTFSLFHIGGYAHAEIAALLDVPVNTVRSRLQTARRLLRADLQALYSERKTTMSSPARTEPAAARVARDPLPPSYETLIRSAFPEARIVSAERRPETWMPFYWRSRLALPDGTERSVDVRAFASILGSTSVGRAEAALLGVLKRQGLPVPELLAGPLPDPENPQGGNPVALTAAPAGENLLLWALESNLPHRVRAATALAIEAIDRLHGLTDALLADPVGASLPRRPLLLDLSEIAERGGPWMDDPLFAGAVRRLTPLVQEISEATPLVYTNDLYLPNFLRAAADTDGFDVKAPFGWPGDPRASDLQITEFVIPFGWLGDPLLGLAKFWTYDCYPFVHTGFVERYLYERGITRRDFAPRLAVRALWTLQRELPVSRPAEGPEYWDSLVGLLKHALQSLD